MSAFLRRFTLLALTLVLAGCASVPEPQAQRQQVLQTAGSRIGTAIDPAAPGHAQLPAGPLDADTAVRIALARSPALDASLAALALSEADRAQAAALPNPHFAFSRLREGRTVELERLLRFNVLDLFTLPWRARLAGEQTAVARLQAAQEVIRVAADTRKAWVQAVAAAQTARYLRDAMEAAEAGAELARRMVAAGNFSRLQQAREQSTLAEVSAQLARAEQQAVAARERLTRLMGLWGTEAAAYTLPDRLPELPGALVEPAEIEATAVRERLDVRAAREQALQTANALGYTRATALVDGVELGLMRNTTFDNAGGHRDTTRGWELELTLPLFDQGQARNARGDASLRLAQARLRDTAVRARSEAREAWHGWRTAYDLAQHYRDEVVPLRRFISDETLLRYNGMLASVWDLLAETRHHVTAVTGAIAAQRDFWIADTDLRTALTGTSPGALAELAGGAAAPANEAKGH